MNWMMKNSAKKPDAMLTFAFIAFVVTIIKFLLNDVSISMLETSFDFGTIDASIIAALLTPTMGSYVLRRGTDKKYLFMKQNGNDDSTEENVNSDSENMEH